jgi:L-lactate dehydrogenase complex protein LldG
MAREQVLERVRAALARRGESRPVPPPRIRIPQVDVEDRVTSLLARISDLAGKTHRAATAEEARALVEAEIAGGTAVASNSPVVAECGIPTLHNVCTGVTDRSELRRLCATADFGITGADYALADTGSLVMIASPEEARLISLLPPAHIALVRKDRILTGLDELFALVPKPSDRTSSMVLITGPSRTADIEQILVRGVHGPGRLTVIAVG